MVYTVFYKTSFFAGYCVTKTVYIQKGVAFYFYAILDNFGDISDLLIYRKIICTKEVNYGTSFI